MIRQYANEIYPRRLWVLTEDDFDKFKKEFRIDDDNASSVTDEHLWDRKAVSIRCFNIKTRELGSAVLLRKNWEYTLGNILDVVSHEVSHCTIHTSETLGIGCSSDNSEPFCYLIGYYARCIGHYIENEMGYKITKEDGKSKRS